MVVAFRRHTLLPLDDCLYALQLSIPHLTRSALHRCLQRHGISRLPDVAGDKRERIGIAKIINSITPHIHPKPNLSNCIANASKSHYSACVR